MIEVEQVLEDLNELIGMQKDELVAIENRGQGDDEYMLGLYNGMVLVRALIMEEDPIYE